MSRMTAIKASDRPIVDAPLNALTLLPTGAKEPS